MNSVGLLNKLVIITIYSCRILKMSVKNQVLTEIIDLEKSFDYVAIINHGRLAAIDRPENLRHTMKNCRL